MKIIPFSESSDVKKLPQTEILYDDGQLQKLWYRKGKKGRWWFPISPTLFRSMISFVVVDNKLKFTFNAFLTQKADLDIHDDFKSQPAVYIEDPEQTCKISRPGKVGKCCREIVGGLQRATSKPYYQTLNCLRLQRRSAEQEKSIPINRKINSQISAFRNQEDSLERQRARN